MIRLRTALLCGLFAALCAAAHAGQRTILLRAHVDLDEAGFALRQAITAQELAARDPLPHAWTQVRLARGAQAPFGEGRFLLFMEDSPAGAARLLWVDDSGPRDAVLASGDEADFGGLRVLVASVPPPAGRAPGVFVVRRSQPAPLLAEPPSGFASAARIFGDEDPRRLTIRADDPRLLAFAEAFLRELNAGHPPEEAAGRARQQEPPPSAFAPAPGEIAVQAPGAPVHAQPSHMLPSQAAAMPSSAMVTLMLVRAEDWALRELSGSAAYDSAGTTPDRPRVGASGGPGGGEVRVGSPGDRFRARLRALEAQGSLQVESESWVRVPLGGGSSFAFFGPAGGVDGHIHARPAGRNAVDLMIDQRGGDWSFLGAVATRVRLSHGGTATLARHTSTRTETYRSGPPLVGGFPFVGPMLGQTRETRQGASYALFASVALE